MSLLRQRFACLRPLRQPHRIAGLASQASTTHADYFDDLSGLPPPTAASPEDDASPTGDAYPPPNPIAVNQSKAAEIATAQFRGNLYSLHCKAARYNTILSATRPDGHIIRTVSAGALGFKGVNRRSYEAAYQCAMATFKALERAMEVEAEPRWQLYLKGFGQGREAVQKAVLSAEGEMLRRKLVKVIDRTPIKIGGTRAMKQKR